MQRKTYSPLAIASIKAWESLRLKAYRDEKGIWTVGYGSTTGAVPGLVVNALTICTPDQANEWLETKIKAIAADIDYSVTVELNQNQFDALVSLIYNVGSTAFHRSKLLARLNNGDPDAADEMLDWCFEHRGGQLVKSAGLENRRRAEYTLFHTPIDEEDAA
jgi:lysozyme